MANLYTGTVDLTGFHKVTELTNVTFEKGKTYSFQFYNPVFFRVGTTGYGDLITDTDVYTWVCSDDDLYIGKYATYNNMTINIAEYDVQKKNDDIDLASITKSPLEYLTDTTGNLKYQNINTTTMSGSANNGYASDYSSSMANDLLYRRGSYDYVSFTTQGCTSLPSLVWFETALTNGINLSLKMGGGFSTYTYTYVLGHYSDATFIEDAHVFALISGRASAIYFPATGGKYDLGDMNTDGVCLNISQNNTTLKYYKANGETNWNQSIPLSNDNASALSLATHVRVIKLNSQGSYQDARELSLSEIRVINPPIGSSEVATLPASDAVALFNSGTNIFDAHPESLGLKYDSTYFAVDNAGKLTLSSQVIEKLNSIS